MSNVDVLVAGGGGFIGGHLVADLKKQGLYNINRGGYYQKPHQRNSREFADVRARFGRPSALVGR